jgi:mannosyltransferase
MGEGFEQTAPSAPAASLSWRPRPGLPFVCGMAAFAFFLIGVSGPSFWIDEGHTWGYAHQSLGAILATTLGSTNAVEAAYYVLLHLWMSVAGDSELALRLPSVLAMAVAVWAVTKTALGIAGGRGAAAAAFVMIALPGVTRYAQEARPYAFMVAAVAISTLVLSRALARSDGRWWVGYGIALVAVGYFHLVSLLVVAGQLVAVLVIDSTKWRRFAITVALAGAAILPLVMLGAGQHGQISWIPPETLETLWTGPTELTGSIALTASLGLLVLVLGGDRRLLALGVPTALATPVLLWIAGNFGPIYLGRYLMGATPGIALAVGGALAVLRPGRALLAAAVIAGLVIPQQIGLRDAAAHGQDYRAAAQYVVSDCSARIAYDYQSSDAMHYYLRDKPCSPSETAASDHLWVVQCDPPQVAETGYRLIRSRSFGRAIVSYWVVDESHSNPMPAPGPGVGAAWRLHSPTTA